MRITDLSNGLKVDCRIGRIRKGQIIWGRWKRRTLHLRRRDVPLPDYLKEVAKGFAEVGDIVDLGVGNSIKFTQSNYQGQGIFADKVGGRFLQILNLV